MYRRRRDPTAPLQGSMCSVSCGSPLPEAGGRVGDGARLTAEHDYIAQDEQNQALLYSMPAFAQPGAYCVYWPFLYSIYMNLVLSPSGIDGWVLVVLVFLDPHTEAGHKSRLMQHFMQTWL